MSPEKKQKPKVYTRYPLSGLFIYNGSTIAHYVLGGTGIILGYSSWVGYLVGTLYLLFSFTQMYILMPLAVCPNCVYYRMNNSLCVSGMNVISRKLAKEGSTKDFSKRAQGWLCHNNAYILALVIPIVAIIPALVLDFSYPVLAILISVIILLLLRFFVIFPREACIHCAAKNICPQAESMGLRDS